MTVSSTHIERKHKRHNKGLVLIAAYKLFLALIFFAVGVGALRLIGKDVGDILSSLASDLRFNPEGRFVNFILDRASLLDDPALRRIGFGAFCYAAIGIVEAIGLYLEKRGPNILRSLLRRPSCPSKSASSSTASPGFVSPSSSSMSPCSST